MDGCMGEKMERLVGGCVGLWVEGRKEGRWMDGLINGWANVQASGWICG